MQEEVARSSVSVRYIIDDVPAALHFYTTLLGFTEQDGVRLPLSGDGSSGKQPLPDGREQVPGGWNRVHLEVSDLTAEVARLGVRRRGPSAHDIVSGLGGTQVILDDRSGNPVELFQPGR